MAAASNKVYGEDVGDTKMEELRRWQSMSREDRIKDLRSRTENVVAGDKADDETLTRLHVALKGMGH